MNWRSYWPSFAAVAAAGLALAGAETRTLEARPPRPGLPPISRSFIAEYDGTAAHDIFYHGLFGADEPMRQADIFLLGSSHFYFGLSARQMSEILSRDGRPRRVFNMAAGCGEAVRFGLDILARFGISDKSAIGDASALDAPLSLRPEVDIATQPDSNGAASLVSHCARDAEQRDDLAAYAYVLRIWTKFLYDWALDPLLPRLALTPGGVQTQRFLNGLLVERDWQSGDAVLAWHPVAGIFYPKLADAGTKVETAARTLGADWQISDRWIVVDDGLLGKAAALHMDLSVGLIPWAMNRADYLLRYEALSALLRSEPSPRTRCLAVVPEGPLTSWDGGNHLTGASRSFATETLASTLEERHCLDAGVTPHR